MTRTGRLRWAWLILKTWTANQRSQEHYATLNAADQWQRVLTPTASSTWAACLGPWIGSDWTRVSLHQAGLFFRRQLITQPTHSHAADDEGPSWMHGARSGWQLLRSPSSQFWWVLVTVDCNTLRLACAGARAWTSSGPLHQAAVHRRDQGSGTGLRRAGPVDPPGQ